MNYILGETKIDSSFPIAVVVSRFNEEVTKCMQDGALSRLHEKGFKQEDISLVEVPGAIEIPLVVKKLAKQSRVKAIVALGAVIRGETSHYDYVCSQVSEGCQKVMLEYEIPVIFGVLTTENKDQAMNRLGGAHGHKAVESIDSAIEMYSIIKQLT